MVQSNDLQIFIDNQIWDSQVFNRHSDGTSISLKTRLNPRILHFTYLTFDSVQPPPELIHPNDSYYFQSTPLPLPYAWSHAAPHVTGPSEHQNYYPQTYPTHHIQPWDDAVITHAQPVS